MADLLKLDLRKRLTGLDRDAMRGAPFVPRWHVEHVIGPEEQLTEDMVVALVQELVNKLGPCEIKDYDGLQLRRRIGGGLHLYLQGHVLPGQRWRCEPMGFYDFIVQEVHLHPARIVFEQHPIGRTPLPGEVRRVTIPTAALSADWKRAL